MSPEIISEIANMALALSLIVAIIFGIAQINTARRDRRDRLTLETLHTFHSREFAGIILFTTNNKFPQTLDEWQQWPRDNQEMYIQQMQQMESLGIMLADKLISMDLLDKTLGSYISTLWNKSASVIQDMRVKYNDPFLSEYFQWMAGQIDNRMKSNPRQPFFLSAK